jgi:hypothetical protein
MSAPENQAAWLLGVGKAIGIGPAPLPTPSNGELLIKVIGRRRAAGRVQGPEAVMSGCMAIASLAAATREGGGT